MADEAFGDLISFTDVEHAVLAHYKHWMNTWLAARERKLALTVGSIARPRSYIVKQTFTALPGEERTPIVIAVSDGFSAEPVRRGTGSYDGLFRFGIAAMCMGGLEGQARVLCGHYQTALIGIALRHRSISDGLVTLDDFVNLRIEDIDEESAGRSLCAVRMEVIYRVHGFAAERPVPAFLPDVTVPQADEKQVQTVLIGANNYQADEELP